VVAVDAGVEDGDVRAAARVAVRVGDVGVDAVDAPRQRLAERVHLAVLLDVAYVRVVPQAVECLLGELPGDGCPDVAEVQLSADLRGLLPGHARGGAGFESDDVALRLALTGCRRLAGEPAGRRASRDALKHSPT
jgi:hypothetical protein